VTWTEGRKRPTFTPAPRTIAWVARGVVMNRSSSAVAGAWLCAGSTIAAHRPCARIPGPCMQTMRPAARSAATAKRTARVTPFDRLVCSRAAASLWKIRWFFSGTPSSRNIPGTTPSSSAADGPTSQVRPCACALLTARPE
jgi:hypothetical protein